MQNKEAEEANLLRAINHISVSMQAHLRSILKLSARTLEDGGLSEGARVSIRQIADAGGALIPLVDNLVSVSGVGAGVPAPAQGLPLLDPEQNTQPAQLSFPNARVLVVDDMQANLDIARGMMKPYGMQIDAATSGQEAIDAIRGEKAHYDAIFMDHIMPGMSGIEATGEIRALGTDYASRIPIIALTANALAGYGQEFLSKGFQAFISKPIQRASLEAVLRRWLPAAEANTQAQPLSKDRVGLTRRSGIDRRALKLGAGGLDIGKAIAEFGGDVDFYYAILHSYVVNTAPLLDQCERASVENITEYGRIVHGIKGSSRGICADEFAKIAERMEIAAKEGDLAFILRHNPSFLDAARDLLSGIGDMLEERTRDHPRPWKEWPDRRLLDKLRAACEAYDMKTVDATLGILATFEYEHEGDLIPWLKDNAEKLNLSAIIEKLDEYFIGRQLHDGDH